MEVLKKNYKWQLVYCAFVFIVLTVWPMGWREAALIAVLLLIVNLGYDLALGLIRSRRRRKHDE